MGRVWDVVIWALLDLQATSELDLVLFSDRNGLFFRKTAAVSVVRLRERRMALGGYLIVRQSDAHAWSEIWVDGRGWLRVDPTAAVAPERIEQNLVRALAEDEAAPGRLRDASPLWLQVELTWDTLNDFWNERVVRFNAARQMNLLEKLGFEDPDWRTLGLGLAAFVAHAG